MNEMGRKYLDEFKNIRMLDQLHGGYFSFNLRGTKGDLKQKQKKTKRCMLKNSGSVNLR